MLGSQQKKTFMLHYEFPGYATNEISVGLNFFSNTFDPFFLIISLKTFCRPPEVQIVVKSGMALWRKRLWNTSFRTSFPTVSDWLARWNYDNFGNHLLKLKKKYMFLIWEKIMRIFIAGAGIQRLLVDGLSVRRKCRSSGCRCPIEKSRWRSGDWTHD